MASAGGRAHRGAHRADCPEQRRGQADQPGDDECPGARLVEQKWKSVQLGIDLGVETSQPRAQAPPQQDAESGDHHHHLCVMPADLGVAVPEGLHQADLAAFGDDQAAKDHVGQERSDGEEDDRQDGRRRPELLDLVHQEPVGDLVFAAESADAAVAVEQPVEVVDHLPRIGAAQQRQRQVVEGAVEIVGRGQRLSPHPQDAEPLLVGHQRAGPDGVDVLRRQRDADDPKRPFLAVHDCLQPIAWLQLMGLGERLAEHGLVGLARLDRSPGADHQAVEHRLTALRDRHQVADHRLVESRDVEGGEFGDARLDRLHPRYVADPLCQVPGGAFDPGEDVRKTIALVIRLGALLQGFDGAERHNQDGNAGGHHQGDRDDLAAQP